MTTAPGFSRSARSSAAPSASKKGRLIAFTLPSSSVIRATLPSTAYEILSVMTACHGTFEGLTPKAKQRRIRRVSAAAALLDQLGRPGDVRLGTAQPEPTRRLATG